MSPPLILVFLLSLVVIHPLCVSAQNRCVPASTASDAQLQANIDWGCSAGQVDCGPVHPGGNCYDPNTVGNHALYVMNAYYQSHGQTSEACDFKSTGLIVTYDPSYGTCKL
ncbi:Major pollen allergen Ole e 10 [Cardamine amara subsp. amara]|uniref:Major pollen allergen Ole e 10 n=1 Tax=Cardamine amara subsp. amara TaxID=228776 RepID=A0ABD1B2T8_CARAN